MAIFVSSIKHTSSASAPAPPFVPARFAGAAGTLAGTNEPPSMAESVTRHAQNPPASEYQLLACGIDTLDLGLYVSWDSSWPKTKAYLTEKKEEAQGQGCVLDRTDIGRQFLHLSSGKAPNYRYQFQFPEYRIYPAISDKAVMSPNVYVTISANTLWHVDVASILELLEFDACR